MDSETEKWEDQENEIVQHGQGMSSMAYSMYLFTRGEGLLKTTQDLFHQAEIFATEGMKLASALQVFSEQVHDDDKPLLMLEAEKLIPICKQLQITAKTSVQGKSATFTKVDACIQKTRNVMTLLCQLLPVCSRLMRKNKAGNGYLKPAPPWREGRTRTGTNAHTPERRVEMFGIKSLENHLTKMTFLESK